VLPVPVLVDAGSPPATSAATELSSAPLPDTAAPASLRISMIQSPPHSMSKMSFIQDMAMESDDFQIAVSINWVEHKKQRIYEVSAVTGHSKYKKQRIYEVSAVTGHSKYKKQKFMKYQQ